MKDLNNTINAFMTEASMSLSSITMDDLHDAFVKGYFARLQADSIRIIGVTSLSSGNWYDFNYGRHEPLSWNEACLVPFCELPTRDQFEQLTSRCNLQLHFRRSTGHTMSFINDLRAYFVDRETDYHISFYDGHYTCYSGEDVLEESRYNHFQIWLHDELDGETALTAYVSFTIPYSSGTTEFEVKYIPVHKSKKLCCHFLQGNDMKLQMGDYLEMTTR